MRTTVRHKTATLRLLAVLGLGTVLLVPACSTSSSATGTGGATAGSSDSKNFTFDNVVKLSGSTWFERMGVGVQAFSKATGTQTYQEGPAQPTAEQQVSMITSLIPQHPTAIGVDPDDVGASEGVLAQAQKAGIIVVSQEAATMQNTDFDLEAFNNATYGKDMMDALATCMGGQGQYAAFVGGLTVSAHMEWVSAALSEDKAKYPGITRVGSGPYVSNESETTAYQETQQILAKYPHIKGFEGSASVDLPGIAKAVEAAGLAGKVCIVGTAEPVLAKQYIENGTVYEGFVWDPSLAGEATMYAAQALAEHKKVTTGTDLHVPGYTDIQPCGPGTTSHCFEGNAELRLTKANIGQYNF